MKLFDLNSPLMQALSRLADMVFLSFIWFVCCLPVITIGPSTAAMCFVAMKLARKEDIRVIQTFFKSFKVNFKQGIILTLIFLIVGAILVLDLIYIANPELGNGAGISLLQGGFMAMSIWALCIMFYTFPLQAQFYNPIRITLKNAAVLAIQKLWNTIVVFFLNLLPVILIWGSIKMTNSLELFVRTAPIWVLVAPGVLAVLCGKRFVKIFDPYLNPKEEKEETEEEEA